MWKRLRKVLVTKDYVRHRFTGDYLTDPFDAVGTQLYDLDKSAWSEELCRLIDFDSACLPEVHPSHSIAGRLSGAVAGDVGLPAGIPIAVGGADSSVEAFGTGAVGIGDGIVKLGTSCCVNVVTERMITSHQTLTYPYLFGGLGFTVAATTNGTATLKWFRSEVLSRSDFTFDEIVRAASRAPAGSNGLIFHPYLMGERTPYWDPRLRGAFLGLGSYHGVAELARALLEGVAFSMRDCLETLRGMSLPIRKLSLLGGGSKSDLWCRIVADVFRMELTRPSMTDASFGAALLAGISVNMFSDWNSARKDQASDQLKIYPVPEIADIYEEYYRVFRQSVLDMAPHYHRLHELSARTGVR
jgi:xylulokinase